MIITRSPLRISLGGGGTDLPSYYKDHEGFLIAGAIDKYVYINLHDTFSQKMIIKYSQIERVKSVEEISHPIIRESLKLLGFTDPDMEITSMADIPAGTGLGSSGSFTTALLQSLQIWNREIVLTKDLAEEACRIELDILKEPIGKQDQYIAAYGGLTCFKFLRDGSINVWPLKIDKDTMYDLEDNLLLFFTGYTRSASNILKDQNDKSKDNNQEMIDNLHFTKELGYKSKDALESGNLEEFANLMNVHWEHKKKRTKGMSNSHIDELYALALVNGAIGGKIIGAGGGGFLMFYANDQVKLRKAMRNAGVQEVRFRFDLKGTDVIENS